MIKRIHQLLPAYVKYDAISNIAKNTHDLIREMDFSSNIFAGAIDSDLQNNAYDADSIADKIDNEDLVLYHFSIGSSLSELFLNLRAHKAIVFHNITPPFFFHETNPLIEFWLKRGYMELKTLANKVDKFIADSTYNALVLEAFGAKNVNVIPPLIKLRTTLGTNQIENSNERNILFVGRFAPNKGHLDLISTISLLKNYVNFKIKLICIGSATDNDAYIKKLYQHINNLDVNENVQLITEKIDNDTLDNYYAKANIFACASEHEGFCIPLVEAMRFGIPIVAFDAGAVKETVGKAAIILNSKDPFLWAKTLEEILINSQLSKYLIEEAKVKVQDYDYARLKKLWITQIDAMANR